MIVTRTLRLQIFIGVILFLSLPNFVTGETTKSTEPDSEFLFVDFTDSYLSVQAQNADINELFTEITRKTGVKIESDTPTNVKISIDFKKKGFTRGMKLILSQLEPEEYKGKLKLGQTFAGSIYTIHRISEQENSARREKASFYNSQGEKLLAEGKDYQAYRLFIKALRSDRNFLPAHKNLVSIYELWEDHEKLSKRLERVINLDDDDVQNYKLLADAYRYSFRYNEAVKNYRNFLGRSNDKITVEKVKAILSQMNTQKNKEYFQKIIEAKNLMKIRQFEQAKRKLNQAVHIDSSNTGAYELMAILYELNGNYEMAGEWRKKVLELASDRPKNLLLLGRNLRILSKYETGTELLIKAKQLSNSEYIDLLVEKELRLMK